MTKTRTQCLLFLPFHRTEFHSATHKINKLSGCYQPFICYKYCKILIKILYMKNSQHFGYLHI